MNKIDIETLNIQIVAFIWIQCILQSIASHL